MSLGSAETVSCVHSHLKGRRDQMEDAYFAYGRIHEMYPFLKKWLPGGAGVRRRWAAFGVFDGHGGAEIAELCRERMLDEILTESFVDDVDEAFVAGFHAMDEQALAVSEEGGITSGCTALVVLVLGSMLFVAHVGDSLAVLSRDGSAVLLTQPHCTANSDEGFRIKREGLMFSGSRLVHPVVETMSIALTRAIGDISWKHPDHTGGQSTGIIATPETRQEVLYDVDEFLLIACDGFWDVFLPQEAVDAVRLRIEQGLSRQEIVDDMVTEALRLGSSDNITLLIVDT